MRPLTRCCVALALLALALLARPTSAQEWFHVDQCDTYVLNGHEVEHLVLTIRNNTPSAQIYIVSMSSRTFGAIDTCHAVSFAAPPGWAAVPTGDGHPFWLALNADAALIPGEAQGGFELTLTRPACCFDTILNGPVDLGPPWDALVSACFDCASGAVPTKENSWGACKALYR